MFTEQNTSGFKPDELERLNKAHELLMKDHPESQRDEQLEKHYADALSNAWLDDKGEWPLVNSVEELVKRCRHIT